MWKDGTTGRKKDENVHLSTKTGHANLKIGHGKKKLWAGHAKTCASDPPPLDRTWKKCWTQVPTVRDSRTSNKEHRRRNDFSISFRTRQEASRFAVAGILPLAPDLRTPINASGRSVRDTVWESSSQEYRPDVLHWRNEYNRLPAWIHHHWT